MKKKVVTGLSVILVLVTALSFAACSDKKDGRKSDSFVRIEMNPSVEMIVDSNDKVVSVYGANTDGKVLLYGETAALEGQSVENVVNRITDLAVKMGYVSEENNVINYTVSSPDGEKAEESLKSVIDAKIKATARDLGLTVETDSEGAYSLLSRFNAFKEEHPDNEAIQSLTISEFRLALSASETGEVTLEAAVNLDDSQLVAIIKKASETIKEYAIEAYTSAVALAGMAFDSASDMILDSVYTTYYTANTFQHLSTWYYGYVYQMYASAAHGLQALDAAWTLKNKISAAPLSEDCVKKVMATLGLEESDLKKIKDAEGNVTLDSIYAYADKTFKNSDFKGSIDEAKASLDKAISEAENEYNEVKNKIYEEYAPQIEALYNQLSAVAKTAKTMIDVASSFVPQSVKEAVNELLSAAEELWTTLNKENLAQSDFVELKDKYLAKAQETLEKIKADLTEEELAKIERIRAEAAEKIKKYREVYNRAVEKASAEAKAFIEKIRAERLNSQNA